MVDIRMMIGAGRARREQEHPNNSGKQNCHNPFSLRQLQDEQRPWVAHNFPERTTWMPLLGVMEELGELAHAHLKQAQGIRTHEDHNELARDAVADIVIFLADYCSARGFDLETLVSETWAKVKQRDWRVNPDTAHEVESE